MIPRILTRRFPSCRISDRFEMTSRIDTTRMKGLVRIIYILAEFNRIPCQVYMLSY